MEKDYKHSIILGKFLPPHKGHFWLIDKALEKSEHLTILVCALNDIVVDGKVIIKREAIPGWQRQAWLKEAYQDQNVNVVLVTAENPQQPDDHDLFWDIWANTIKTNARGCDAIFTSEEYGDNLSALLGIPHHKIDGHRFKYNVSGRDILRDPHAYWEFIPSEVTPHFTKKVALVGPESVGKSTFSKKVSQRMGIPYLEEYGREYVEHHLQGELKPEDLAVISAVHQERIKQKSKNEKFLLLDTEAITTYLWCEFYCGAGSTPVSLLNRAWAEHIDLYLVLLPTVPWFDDGSRSWGDQTDREIYSDMFIDILERKGASFALITSKDYKSREDQILKHIGHSFGKYPGGTQHEN